MVAEGFTWRDASGRSLTLSGQVNPAFNVVDDGISTDVFIVDNDTSGTRFRLDADAPLGETSHGATLEIGASPNNSSTVNQLDGTADADCNVRRAEVTIRNDRYGRLQLGRTPAPPATPPTSRSSPARSCSPASPTSPGILFTDGTDYSDTTVGDACFDFDGGRLARSATTAAGTSSTNPPTRI